MNIIHVVPSVSDEASGPSYSVTRLCKSLVAGGEAVVLASAGRAPDLDNGGGQQVFVLGIGPSRLGRSPDLYKWLSQQAERGTCDILHSHGLWMMPNIYPGWVARKYRVPLVVSPRGTMSTWAFNSGSRVKKFFWPLVQRPALAAVKCFHATAVSECTEIRALGFEQSIAVIPNGIDVPCEAEKPDRDFRSLLFLGRVHPKKGIDTLLLAWRQVQSRFPEWHLRIVGPDDGGHLRRYQAMAERLSLRRVEFAGPLYGPMKSRAYQDADLFVLPTFSENFGVAVAESLAAGVPAIVSKGAPWSGLSAHGAGWWIDIGVDPLVACLERALACSPATLENMGRAGRAWMERDYDWRVVGDMMAAVYRWVLDGGVKPDFVFD